MPLRERFIARVLEEEPTSVLDIGCGTGGLLAKLRDCGIPVVGLESSNRALATVVKERLQGIQGNAWELPFADASFDWVSMRHVPHHLSDVRGAFSEALRVGRRGLLVAEPWFDTTLASQRTAEALDLWRKKQDRLRGQVHEPALAAQEIFEALPASLRCETSSEHFLQHRRVPIEVVREEVAPVLDQLAPDSPERRAFDEIAAAIESDGMTYNGTVICRIVVLSRA